VQSDVHAFQHAILRLQQESSKLAKYEFQPYWPEKKLRVCVTGAGGELHGSVPLVATVISATVRCMLMSTLCWRPTEAV
jgi:hypothetical protein